MFVNGVEVISSRLENISLDIHQSTMQPKADRPPVCPNGTLPRLHLTPSNGGHKKDSSPQADSPWLLKPKHDIPATPPPQAEPQQFFKMG